MVLAVLLVIAALLSTVVHRMGGIMAGEKELAERVKALSETLGTGLDNITGVVTEGVADIRKIHDLLDANTGSGADVPGANAALDALEAKFAAAAEALANLRTAIDIPEPGDTPPGGG